MTLTAKPVDCVVRGAGIIGLSSALEMALRGADIVLVDPVWPPRGASWAAAGMIAPAFEAAGQNGAHDRLFELCMKSARLWPEWSDHLTRLTAMASGYSSTASKAVAIDEETDRQLASVLNDLDEFGVEWQELAKGDLPGDAYWGARLPSDTQVDNRLMIEALITACEQCERITISRDERAWSDALQLVTAGWQTPGCLPVPLPIYPVSGQMVSLERGSGDPIAPVRCGSVYIAPKSDRIIIGATVEPNVKRQDVDQANIFDLMRTAARLFPDLAHRKIVETWAGIRPGSPDHAPFLGQVDARTFVAAGHHRNGILLAPLTARYMADLILEGRSTDLLQAFSPLRGVAAP
ncbi:MAG: FAD-dependent oxidoreductase [Pseudomonadota bacterium]